MFFCPKAEDVVVSRVIGVFYFFFVALVFQHFEKWEKKCPDKMKNIAKVTSHSIVRFIGYEKKLLLLLFSCLFLLIIGEASAAAL